MGITLFLSEREKPLSQVIEPGEQAHADEHGHIVPHRRGRARQGGEAQRLGDAVGEQVAHCDVDCKAEHLGGAFFPAFKGKVFVKEKAH